MKNKRSKIVIACLMSLCLSIAMFAMVVWADGEQSETYEVQMVKFTDPETVKACLNGDVAPTVPEGTDVTDYLFAGWYKTQDHENIANAITKEADLVGLEEFYALYVPTQVLGVKMQILEALRDDDVTNDLGGKIRFVTSVDSLNYSQVGFKLSYNKGDGVTEREYVNKKVYSELWYMDGSEQIQTTAAKEFCNLSKYFKAIIMSGLTPNDDITQNLYNMKFEVTPYWVTLDGTVVMGKTATKAVVDGMFRPYLVQADTSVASAVSFVSTDVDVESGKETEKEIMSLTAVADTAVTVTVDDAVEHYTEGDSLFLPKPAYDKDSPHLPCVTVTGGDKGQSTGTYEAKIENGYYTELEAAFDVIRTNTTVEVLKNAVEVESTMSVDASETATVKNAEEISATINRAATFTGNIFNVTENGTLTVNGFVLDGRTTVEIAANTTDLSAIKGTASSMLQSAGKVTVKNATFRYIKYNGTDKLIGAGVTGKKGNVVVQNSTFENINSTGQGAAVYVDNSTEADISGSTFKGNTSTRSGGAVAILSTSKETIITDCIFENNSAVNGAGLFVNHASAVVTVTGTEGSGARFKGNKAETSGGAIRVSGGTLNITGYDFDANTAAKTGGAIHVQEGSMTIGTSEFVNNSTDTEDGGAICQNGTGTLTITSSTFATNTAIKQGGAISYHASGEATISNSTFEQNQAVGQEVAEGETATVVPIGGAIYHNGANSMTISGTQFTGNTAANGGAVYGADTDTGTQPTLIVNSSSKFSNNTATASDGKGGAVYSNKTAVSIAGSEFSGNGAYTGGGIYSNQAAVSIAGSEFIGNTANISGAVHFENASLALTIENSKFVQNKSTDGAKGAGAALRSNTKNTTIKNCEIVQNDSKTWGTVIIQRGADISDTTIKGNKASYAAAMGVLNDGIVTLTDCDFGNNYATAEIEKLKGTDIRLAGAGSKVTLAGKVAGKIYAEADSVITVKDALSAGSDVELDWNASTADTEVIKFVDAEGANNTDIAEVTANQNYIRIGQRAGNKNLVLSYTDATGTLAARTEENVATVNGTGYTTLKAAVEDAALNSTADVPGEVILTSKNPIMVTETISLSGKYVTIKDDGTRKEIRRAVPENKTKAFAMFDVKDGAVLNVESTSGDKDNPNIIISGASEVARPTSTTSGTAVTWPTWVMFDVNSTTASTLNITDGVKLVDNVNGISGIILRVRNAAKHSVTLNQVVVANNRNCGGAFGALYINRDVSEVTITDTDFINNHGSKGGALYLSAGTVNLTNNEYLYNTATTEGSEDICVHDVTATRALKIQGKFVGSIYHLASTKVQVVGNLTEGSNMVLNWARKEAITRAVTFGDAEMMEASKLYIKLGSLTTDCELVDGTDALDLKAKAATE